MRRALLTILAVAGLSLPAGSVPLTAPSAATAPFPDYGRAPPASELKHQRVFKLSQAYPTREPALDPEIRSILAIDYHKTWKVYARHLFDYVTAGNIEHRAVADSFYVEDNPVRRWYHVPWMHWGDSGREVLHGLTPEGPVRPNTLWPNQSDVWQTYAVGFYNAPGGYTIGRVWRDHSHPRMDALDARGFPVGTVVAKLMFTTAPVSQAPYSSDPIEWSAYIKKTFSYTLTGLPIAPRHFGVVRLLQLDAMVRDDRAKATGGWVFVTWVYSGLQDTKRAPNDRFDSRWLNLMPVGLMWGQDPGVLSHLAGNPAPVTTLVNPDLKETIINDDPAMPPMHLGFGMRLVGPADNYLSSCKSCHSVAEFPDVSSVLPFNGPGDPRGLACGGPEWMRWFQNLPLGQPFDQGSHSMDNSLSLALSVQNFEMAKNPAPHGQAATPTFDGRRLVTPANQRGPPPAGSNPCAAA